MPSAGRGNQNRGGSFWISNLLTENENTEAITLLGIFMLFPTVNLKCFLHVGITVHQVHAIEGDG